MSPPASLDTPSQPGTYTVVAASTESDQAMGTIVVSHIVGPEREGQRIVRADFSS